MRVFFATAFFAALCFLLPTTAPAQAFHAGIGTCIPGFVFRGAYPNDQVCVTRTEQAATATQNSLSKGRTLPGAPGGCKPGFVLRQAGAGDSACVTQSQKDAAMAMNQAAQSRMLLHHPELLPEAQRPGDHVLDLRVTKYYANNSYRAFTDQPFIGIFTGHSLDCRHAAHFPVNASGNGADFKILAGWGQVEGDGHDHGTSPCVSWVTSAGVDFDLAPLKAILGVDNMRRAVLSYREQTAPQCMGLVYTQGGFLIDNLPCYTDGKGRTAAKPNGCLALRIPAENWLAVAQKGPLKLLPMTYPKTNSSTWDVTPLVSWRWNPGLNPNNFQPGFGFVLLGTPLSTSSLSGEDNTRCSSQLSDVKLTIYYHVTLPNFDPNARPFILK